MKPKPKAKPKPKRPAGRPPKTADLQTHGNAAPGLGFVQTWDDLATACSVDRRTLTNVRAREATALKQREKEWLKADGRKDIAWWIRFLGDKAVQGRGVNNPEVDFESEKSLRLRQWKLKLDRAEFELAKSKEQLLPVAEFEAALGAMLANFRSAGNAMVGRASGKLLSRARAAILISLKAALSPTVYARVEKAIGTDNAIDFADLEEVIQAEWELVLRTLNQCEYLQADESKE